MNGRVTPARRIASYRDVLDAPETMVADLIRGALKRCSVKGLR